MNNLQKAKASIEEKSAEQQAIEDLINPPPKAKRIKMPLARDVNLVESILNKKLEGKQKQYIENLERIVNKKYKTEIEAIHQEAINLRKKAETFAKEVEMNNPGIKADFMEKSGYNRGYLDELPEDMESAMQEEMFSIDEKDITKIQDLKTEIEDFLINLKIGLAPMEGIKPLLEKIDKEFEQKHEEK